MVGWLVGLFWRLVICVFLVDFVEFFGVFFYPKNEIADFFQ